MEYNEFRKLVLKVKETRTHKINNSWGVYDAYKWLRKNKWPNLKRPLTEHEFYSIIRTVNNYLAEELSNGKDIHFPQRMGSIELRKYTNTTKIVDGKVKTNLPIDWNKTLRLWYENKEAFTNKTLIRDIRKESFKIKYNKYNANYNNKSFFEFKMNRELKKVINDRFNNKIIDAYIL